MADDRATKGFPFGTILDWGVKLVPAVVLGIFFVVQNASKTDANTAALANFAEVTGRGIAALASEVHELRADIKNLPGYEARIASLEKQHMETGATVGLIDGRLRVVEDASARNSTDIENAKRFQYRAR